ncbi:hypothetical protein SO802_026438 [Lithocarpus litseifolius]|uniref:RNase H type-1 domain-containing protein n=1 Tax=Lithocarpus litseifolius TaxID=425828 RepID=A0AAW2C161_9ROSI
MAESRLRRWFWALSSCEFFLAERTYNQVILVFRVPRDPPQELLCSVMILDDPDYATGCYKINMDGVVFDETGSCGVGVIIRNEWEQVMGTMCRKVNVPLGALEVEAKAVEEGILLAWDLSLKDIIVESDAQTVTTAMKMQYPTPHSIQKLMEGILQMLKIFNS